MQVLRCHMFITEVRPLLQVKYFETSLANPERIANPWKSTNADLLNINN